MRRNSTVCAAGFRAAAFSATVFSVVFTLASCGASIPLDVNFIPLLVDAPLSDTLSSPDWPAEIPPSEVTNLGTVTWQIPLHDFRSSIELPATVPAGPITEATLTIGFSTTVDADENLDVFAEALAAVYVSPADAEPWDLDHRESGQTIALGTGVVERLEFTLNETQLSTIEGEPFTLGFELASGEILVTGHPSDLLTFRGFAYVISEIRLIGTVTPPPLL